MRIAAHVLDLLAHAAKPFGGAMALLRSLPCCRASSLRGPLNAPAQRLEGPSLGGPRLACLLFFVLFCFSYCVLHCFGTFVSVVVSLTLFPLLRVGFCNVAFERFAWSLDQLCWKHQPASSPRLLVNKSPGCIRLCSVLVAPCACWRCCRSW